MLHEKTLRGSPIEVVKVRLNHNIIWDFYLSLVTNVISMVIERPLIFILVAVELF